MTDPTPTPCPTDAEPRVCVGQIVVDCYDDGTCAARPSNMVRGDGRFLNFLTALIEKLLPLLLPLLLEPKPETDTL